MNRHPLKLLATLGALVALGGNDPTEPISFARDVAPILVADCLGCHNGERSEGKFDMSTFARLMAGGEILPGASIVPGDLQGSYLIELIQPDADPRMPDGQPPLPAERRAALERWVREGARFDGPSESETLIASLVDPLANLPSIPLLVRASEPAAALAFSSDGSLVAAGRGSDVLLFESENRKLRATLSGHSGRVNSVQFARDDSVLIAAGGRAGMFGAVTVWDVNREEPILEFRGHSDAILGAALSPDEQTLATASYDGTILLWDPRTGELLRTLKEHTDAVNAVAFAPDGRRLASASSDRTIKVWDVATGARQLTLADATAEQSTVLFSPEGDMLLAAGADRLIRSWKADGDAFVLQGQAIAHDGPILRLVADAAGATLYSTGEDRRVMAWDLPSLAPRSTLPAQPDWPIAIAVAPDDSLLAVGGYDGSLALLTPEDGQTVSTLLTVPEPDQTPENEAGTAPEPELVRDVTLGPPSPKGATRGQQVRVVLSGRGIHTATEVRFADAGITARIVEQENSEADRLAIDVKIEPDARPGLHRFRVRTPLGTPAAQSFAISEHPELTLKSAEEGSATVAEVVPLPVTVLGRVEAPGEFREIRFAASPGTVVVAETLARAIGSKLTPVLNVLDGDGRVLAEARGSGREPDPVLSFQAPSVGTYTLRIGDGLLSGSGGHDFRVTIGESPLVSSVSPLGVERGRRQEFTFEGLNLEAGSSTVLDVSTDAEPGLLLSVAPDGIAPTGSTLAAKKVVVAEGPQLVETEEGDTIEAATPLAIPGGATGRIGHPGDTDLYRFEARQGETLIVEVYGRRLGNEIDPVIEILDETGQPVPRAVLKPVATTRVAFRDHGASNRNIRLTTWGDLMVGDYLLAGRELMRLTELPRNPDDDAIFWGLGIHRTNMGERVAFLETTPEHHPQDQLIRKVEVHPPGSTFPPGGAAPVTLNYRNDDAGPGFEGDARLTFRPPTDGTFIARVGDASGFGGDRFGYHLVVREPRPGFTLSLSEDDIHIRRGGGTFVTATVRRLDGFEGAVDVSVAGLPPGIEATPTRIEAAQYAADLLFTAEDHAPEFVDGNWTVTAVAMVDSEGSSTNEIRQRLDPGGPDGGWITVSGEPNLRVTPSTDRLVIRPGQRVTMSLSVERRPPFVGRVPIDVRNLPLAVRVENIGLNGVLVTEEQTEREVSIYAEPWAEPMERPFFAVGSCESAGTQHASRPTWLVIESNDEIEPTATTARVTPN